MMRLQLDTAAVQSLFPEGSEARVELTRAVVAQMLRHMAKKDVTRALGEVEEAYAQAAKLEVARYMDENRTTWPNQQWKMDSHFLAFMESSIKTLVGQRITELVGAQVTEQRLKEKVEALVGIHLDGVFKRTLEDKVNGIIQQAFRK